MEQHQKSIENKSVCALCVYHISENGGLKLDWKTAWDSFYVFRKWYAGKMVPKLTIDQFKNKSKSGQIKLRCQNKITGWKKRWWNSYTHTDTRTYARHLEREDFSIRGYHIDCLLTHCIWKRPNICRICCSHPTRTMMMFKYRSRKIVGMCACACA